MPRKSEIDKENTNRENSLSLIESGGCYCYYANIDYLTIKLVENTEIVTTLRGITEQSPTYLFECGDFKIEFESILYSGQLSVLRLYDIKGNKLGCIHLRNDSCVTVSPAVYDNEGEVILRAVTKKKTNKNVATNIEFTGDFWKLYGEYFPYFCKEFEIDINKQNNVTRLDYCMDIAGIDADDIIKNYRAEIKEGDGKEGRDYRSGNIKTGTTEKTDRHEMSIYNKKLDILVKKKHKYVTLSGERPYNNYLKESFPITRFEYRANARALREASASIAYCFKYGPQLLTSYATKFYTIDLSVFPYNPDGEPLDFKKHKFPVKEDKFCSVMLGKKAYMASRMIQAYCSSYEDYKSESHVFELLYQMYGDRLQEYLFKYHPTREHERAWTSITMQQEFAQVEFINEVRERTSQNIHDILYLGKKRKKSKIPTKKVYLPVPERLGLYEQFEKDKRENYTI